LFDSLLEGASFDGAEVGHIELRFDGIKIRFEKYGLFFRQKHNPVDQPEEGDDFFAGIAPS
jgi:hypothetical protein